MPQQLREKRRKRPSLSSAPGRRSRRTHRPQSNQSHKSATNITAIDYGILKLASTTVSFIIRFPLLSEWNVCCCASLLLFIFSALVHGRSALLLFGSSLPCISICRFHFHRHLRQSVRCALGAIFLSPYRTFPQCAPFNSHFGSYRTATEFCLQLVCACCSHSSRPIHSEVMKTSLCRAQSWHRLITRTIYTYIYLFSIIIITGIFY